MRPRAREIVRGHRGSAARFRATARGKSWAPKLPTFPLSRSRLGVSNFWASARPLRRSVAGTDARRCPLAFRRFRGSKAAPPRPRAGTSPPGERLVSSSVSKTSQGLALAEWLPSYSVQGPGFRARVMAARSGAVALAVAPERGAQRRRLLRGNATGLRFVFLVLVSVALLIFKPTKSGDSGELGWTLRFGRRSGR